HCGTPSARAAPRNGWTAGVGTVWSMAGRGRGPQCRFGSRQRIRPARIGSTGVLEQHAGIGLDSVAHAGSVCRRETETIPAVVTLDGLRGEGFAGRKLLFE